MMPTVDGKIDPSKFLEDVREMNLPTTKLDMLELKKILLEKSDKVSPQSVPHVLSSSVRMRNCSASLSRCCWLSEC